MAGDAGVGRGAGGAPYLSVWRSARCLVERAFARPAGVEEEARQSRCCAAKEGYVSIWEKREKKGSLGQWQAWKTTCRFLTY